MTEIEHYQQTDTWVPLLGPVGDLAQRIAATEFVPRALRGKPAGTAAAILTGRELGLGPMASLRGLQVIEGQVSLTAQMTAARILAAGHRLEWIASTDTAAHVRIVRGDGLGEAEARFTMSDAQRAGIAGKSNWTKWPRAMLRARALSEAAGMICADVILGLDTDAEQHQPPPQGGTTVVQLQAQEPPSEPTEPDPAADTQPPLETPGTPDHAAVIEAESVDMVSRQQMRKIQAQISDIERIEGEKLDRDARRALIAGLIGLDQLASANDLTQEQAGQTIEALDRVIRDLAALAPETGT